MNLNGNKPKVILAMSELFTMARGTMSVFIWNWRASRKPKVSTACLSANMSSWGQVPEPWAARKTITRAIS